MLLSAPVLALSLAGAVAAARERRWRYVLLTAGPFLLAWYYLGAVALSRSRFDQHWHAGFSPPGRFVAAALPLLAVCGATMLDRLRTRFGVDRGRRPVREHACPDAAGLDPPGLAVQPRRRTRHAAGRPLRVHGARCRAPAPLVREPGPRVGGARARGPRGHRAGRPPGGAESGRGATPRRMGLWSRGDRDPGAGPARGALALAGRGLSGRPGARPGRRAFPRNHPGRHRRGRGGTGASRVGGAARRRDRARTAAPAREVSHRRDRGAQGAPEGPAIRLELDGRAARPRSDGRRRPLPCGSSATTSPTSPGREGGCRSASRWPRSPPRRPARLAYIQKIEVTALREGRGRRGTNGLGCDPGDATRLFIVAGARTRTSGSDLNGVWLHFQDWPGRREGAGGEAAGAETVLLLHGLTQQSHAFDAVAARLARRHRCLALDLRGRGESGWAAGTYAIPQYVADVLALLDALGLDAVHVLGTSLGGLVGLSLARAAPDRLRSLALNDIGPEIDPRGAARVAAYAAARPGALPGPRRRRRVGPRAVSLARGAPARGGDRRDPLGGPAGAGRRMAAQVRPGDRARPPAGAGGRPRREPGMVGGSRSASMPRPRRSRRRERHPLPGNGGGHAGAAAASPPRRRRGRRPRAHPRGADRRRRARRLLPRGGDEPASVLRPERRPLGPRIGHDDRMPRVWSQRPLGPDDLVDEARQHLTRQSYAPRPPIAGVVLSEVAVSRSADGLFAEIARIDGGSGGVQGLETFRPVQWNWSLLQPGAVKAWHLHLDQEDLFLVPPDATLLVGLADLRRDDARSETRPAPQRLVLGAGRCHRLLIPRGVAHGVANLGTAAPDDPLRGQPVLHRGPRSDRRVAPAVGPLRRRVLVDGARMRTRPA